MEEEIVFEPFERETIVSTNDEDKTWSVYTRQKKVINKLTKLGYEPLKVQVEDGKVVEAEFCLDLNKITFKKAIVNKREYTEEERAAIAERLHGK